MNQYVKQYQKTHIETASQEAILIMLHDGIIQFLNKAKIAMENKDIQVSHENLIKAQNILYEFLNTIDSGPNPELARNLSLLYNFLINQLVEANMKQIIEPIDVVLDYVKDLKATWEQAVLKSNKSEDADLTEEESKADYDA